MRRRPVVLLDCDGVVADFAGAVCQHLGRITGRPWSTESLREWDFLGTLERDVKSACYREILSKGFCKRLEIFPAAVEGARALSKVADIVWVTSPWMSPTWVSERFAWLERHFGALGKNVVVTRPADLKALVLGDVFVDDKTTSVRAWTRAHPEGLGVVWAQPYNATDTIDPPRIVRLETWEALADVVLARSNAGS